MHTRPNPERYYQITPISRHLSTEDAGEILEYCAANPPATNATLNEQAAIPQILAHLATNLWLIPSLRLFALRLYRELVAKSKGQLSRATLLNGTVNWSALEYELDELLQADPHSPALSQLTASPTQTQLDQITTAIQLRGDWGYYPALLDQLANLLPEQQAHTAPLLSEQQSAYLDSLGTTGWDIFISLLPGWQQDIQALIAVTTASAHR